jgi:hypothetical protein
MKIAEGLLVMTPSKIMSASYKGFIVYEKSCIELKTRSVGFHKISLY